MNDAVAHINKAVDEKTTELFPTVNQLGTNAPYTPIQTQGSEDRTIDNDRTFMALRGILYSLEEDGDEPEAPKSDGIKRIIDGDDIWQKVLQLMRWLTLPPNNLDYIQPTRLLKQIHKGEINTVFGFEILAEERETVLTCILSISLCCGEAAMGTQWQLIAFRLIGLLQVEYIKFFLSKMELHLKNINADILKALLERFKEDADFTNLLRNIFTRQEMLKSDSSPREMLSILSSWSDDDIDLADQSKDKQLTDKVRIVMLNELIANLSPTLNQKERAELIAVIMNKKDGNKINQYLSSGIELTSNYIIIINECLNKAGIPVINPSSIAGKNVYKR